ncbi:MAG: hypothetical protein K2G56_02930, partial [Eubacterium sp.]|nr:hypothetical protein [Eubacterium sp.]
MKKIFEFEIDNSKTALLYAAISSVRTGLLFSVPIIIFVEYIDVISEYDLLIYFLSTALISVISFLNYCLSKKGIAVYDHYILLNFAVWGYGFEPMRRKIEIGSINSIELIHKSENDSFLRDVYGGNYFNGYVKISYGKRNKHYNLAVKNAEEFV